MKWGSFVGSLTPLLLLQTVCLNAEFDVAKCSTSIHPDYLCQKVTEAEMRMHTFHGGLKPHVARKHCKSKITHQGFFLFSNKNEKFPVPKTVPEKDREEWDDVFHIKLPALLRQAAYKKAFSPIFARIIGQEKVSKKFGRFGDGRRLQLKLSVAFKVANKPTATSFIRPCDTTSSGGNRFVDHSPQDACKSLPCTCPGFCAW